MIGTKRLLLRQVTHSDLDDIHALLSLPETDKYNALGIPPSKAVTEKWISEWLKAQIDQPRTSYVFSITSLASNEFIGLIGIILGKEKYRTAEVWFKIFVTHWNKGYTTEALHEIIKFGFEHLHLHRMEAGCAVKNIASSKVLTKAGMTKEGLKRKLIPKESEWLDAFIYAILEEDFYTK